MILNDMDHAKTMPCKRYRVGGDRDEENTFFDRCADGSCASCGLGPGRFSVWFPGLGGRLVPAHLRGALPRGCRHRLSRGIERAWWLGFTLFGWGYMALAFMFSEPLNELPTTTLLWHSVRGLGYPPRATPRDLAPLVSTRRSRRPVTASGPCWPPSIGGILAWSLFGGASAIPNDRSLRRRARVKSQPGWWRRPAIIGLAASLLVVLVAVAGARLAPGLWAGATFLLTCALLGFCALGALCGRGRCRQVWLGAALFGAGYMILTFGRSPDPPSWPSIPTDHFLNALRPCPAPIVGGFPISSHRIDSTKERILQELERPVPMRFPNQTPLEDVLKYIRDATMDADGKGIPIYVDPLGLH